MKKSLLIFALILIAPFVNAQDATFKADVLKVITMSGSDAQMKIVKKQILTMIPAEKQNDFLKEFDATLPSLYDKLAAVYMELYTHDDIKEMIKFYQSPIGLKMQSKLTEFTEKNLLAAKVWGQDLGTIMAKYN
ncbi:DUF2059 domain-containing protein [Flavobacterium sp.]|uniref:DUF2059 domain-containing protein n=1 Tax=Flavobacterium sp. TaxID=239 RepID=UPI002D165EFD|nr:DUF2059 domain-containing protein [Flavobacterium sp.]HSD06930.1 DUF2059 domain-containing protein [Flavobacterium sp.]